MSSDGCRQMLGWMPKIVIYLRARMRNVVHWNKYVQGGYEHGQRLALVYGILSNYRVTLDTLLLLFNERKLTV